MSTTSQIMAHPSGTHTAVPGHFWGLRENPSAIHDEAGERFSSLIGSLAG